jgi:hypothetical protein
VGHTSPAGVGHTRASGSAVQGTGRSKGRCNERRGDRPACLAGTCTISPPPPPHPSADPRRPAAPPRPPGWLDNEPARLTDRKEIRPAAELGPIILCLDTSGSMRGARETVAKALALECMRGAHRWARRAARATGQGAPCCQHLRGGGGVATVLSRMRRAARPTPLPFSAAAPGAGSSAPATCTPSAAPARSRSWSCRWTPSPWASCWTSSRAHSWVRRFPLAVQCPVPAAAGPDPQLGPPRPLAPAHPAHAPRAAAPAPPRLPPEWPGRALADAGGTDVDYPLALSIDRLGKEGWAQADILMVRAAAAACPCCACAAAGPLRAGALLQPGEVLPRRRSPTARSAPPTRRCWRRSGRRTRSWGWRCTGFWWPTRCPSR